MNSLESYLIISSFLFSVGVYAVLSRRNAIAVLMGIELILNSCNLNFIAFNYFNGNAALDGQVISIFIIVLAAAEAAGAQLDGPRDQTAAFFRHLKIINFRTYLYTLIECKSFEESLNCDPISAFGGVVACNFKINKKLQKKYLLFFLK